jgi:hydroxypyruvate reductase
MGIRNDADYIIEYAIKEVQPDGAVKKALEKMKFRPGKIILVSVGKAAWSMAAAASQFLGDRITDGIVITKYGHATGELPNLSIYVAGHPVPDENSFSATDAALELTRGLDKNDNVLFLLSGGGSALFEKPLVSGGELQELTKQMLASGADIVEINTVRKRLSAVKGGKFALHCAPAGVYAIVLSDVIGDPLDMIASGPAYPDSSTCEKAWEIVRKYGLRLAPGMERHLCTETPKQLSNVETHVTGSVRELCSAAEKACGELGYRTMVLTDRLACEAREAGKFLAAIAASHSGTGESLAVIAGGETVVRITGGGKGGRNQELVVSASEGIRGLRDTAIFSVGSDGTDGPTDAAGGYVDGDTFEALREKKISVDEILRNNDSYRALEACGGLIVTGATGTNVNDVSVLLIRR